MEFGLYYLEKLTGVTNKILDLSFIFAHNFYYAQICFLYRLSLIMVSLKTTLSFILPVF